MTPRERARKLFKWLDQDISDRRGLKSEWRRIDRAVMILEIRKLWIEKFEGEFAAVASEASNAEGVKPHPSPSEGQS